MPTATMPTVAPTPQPTTVFAEVSARLLGLTVGRAAAAHVSPTVAADAVEHALQVTDLQAAASVGAQSAVNLKFNVAGETLSVRVALQGGQVHTQFRTDSGELRSASRTSGSQSVRLRGPRASPTRSSPPSRKRHGKPDADLAGDGGRQPGQQRGASDREGDLDTAVLGSALGQAPSAPSPMQEAVPASPVTSSRLHSFA